MMEELKAMILRRDEFKKEFEKYKEAESRTYAELNLFYENYPNSDLANIELNSDEEFFDYKYTFEGRVEEYESRLSKLFFLSSSYELLYLHLEKVIKEKILGKAGFLLFEYEHGINKVNELIKNIKFVATAEEEQNILNSLIKDSISDPNLLSQNDYNMEESVNVKEEFRKIYNSLLLSKLITPDMSAKEQLKKIRPILKNKVDLSVIKPSSLKRYLFDLRRIKK